MIKTALKKHTKEQIEIYDNIIRKYSIASNNYYLLRIENLVQWNEISEFIYSNLNAAKKGKYEDKVLLSLIKCTIFGKIFMIPEHLIPSEISNNSTYMRFIGAESKDEIPKIKLLSSFNRFLIENGMYDSLMEIFYNQLVIDNFEDIGSADVSIEPGKNITSDSNKYKMETDKNEKLYLKMFDLFFDTLDGQKSDDILSEEEIKSRQLIDKLKYVDKIIDELKNKTNKTGDLQSPESKTDNKLASKINVEEPIEFHPQIKKEGMFNDENLTEDYELGYRFHQLGLKMGFFNVKLDNNNESSRISTAEFFPNTFWSSVKQRSRWIAGICLQNWKSHKWKGNLTTKYFLFRDRKPLFSLFGAFFSNLILFYLIYVIIANVFFGGDAVFLVSNSSVLWYLMAANVIFMVSRASHRFIFTYNWYGFRYALLSFFRLLLDTAINFFAVLRSFSVYKKTKKKVVWDSTSHY
jgi:hypothetical protein